MGLQTRRLFGHGMRCSNTPGVSTSKRPKFALTMHVFEEIQPANAAILLKRSVLVRREKMEKGKNIELDENKFCERGKQKRKQSKIIG